MFSQPPALSEEVIFSVASVCLCVCLFALCNLGAYTDNYLNPVQEEHFATAYSGRMRIIAQMRSIDFHLIDEAAPH